MTDNAAPPAGSLVTGSEIARLAGVTRAAVSNWRRRYGDFPALSGGSANSPLFDLVEVQTWLAGQRKGQDVSQEVRLWQLLRGAHGDDMIAGLAEVAEALAAPPGATVGTLPEDAVRLARTLAADGSASGTTVRCGSPPRRYGS
ncbi:helix-turn-helix transcriptional regulator [Streptomyces seoulensis]